MNCNKANDRTCLFCRTILRAKLRSKEHVFPKWLLELLSLNRHIITPTHMTPLGQAISSREHTLGGLVHGRVCRQCNNGWLSSVESAARDLLSPLILGTFHGELFAEESRNIAVWTYKTALVLNSASNYPWKVPVSHYEYLHAHGVPPPDVRIHLAQFKGNEPFYWVQCQMWIANLAGKTPDNVMKLVRKSYKISLQFGELALRVSYWPEGDWPPFRQFGKLISIWPEPPLRLPWPRAQLLAGELALAELHLT